MNTEWLTRIGRILFFPIQLSLHGLARLAHIVASVLAVLSALALTLVLLPEVNSLVGVIETLKFAPNEVLSGIILLADLWLVAYLVDKCKGRVRASLERLKAHFRQALGRSWTPPMVVKEGLLLTWREAVSLPSAIADGFRPSLVIFLSAIIALLATLFTQVAPGFPEPDHEHKTISDQLESLKVTLQQDKRREVVSVVGSRGSKTKWVACRIAWNRWTA